MSPIMVHLPTTNGGADWDFGGGAPDPYVVISTDGVWRATSSYVSDSFDATIRDGSADVSLITGSTMTIQIFDSDAVSDDLAFTCTGSFTLDMLRGRWIVCSDAGGGNAYVFIWPL